MLLTDGMFQTVKWTWPSTNVATPNGMAAKRAHMLTAKLSMSIASMMESNQPQRAARPD
jgi:hypothetical protein